MRRALTAVFFGAVGIALLVAAADALVDADDRGLAGLLALAAAVAFFWLSFCAEPALTVHTDLKGFLQWLAMSVLTLVAVMGYGYLAVSWTQHRAAALRLLADLVVAVVSGTTAALFVVGFGLVTMLVLKLVRLEAEEERWHPPWSRLPHLLARTLGLSVVGVALSVAGEWLAHELDMAPTWEKLIFPALGWLVGSAGAWYLVGRLLHFTPSHHRTRHVVHALGLAAIVLTLGTAGFAESAAHQAKGRLWKLQRGTAYGAAEARAGIAAGLSRAKRDQALAEAFAPGLRFSSDERWHPTSVDWFWSKTQPPVGPFPKQRGKPTCEHTCLALSCDDISGDCTRDAPSDPTMYVLVKHGRIGSELPRGYEDLSTVVQYWLFYDYDSFSRWPISQWHQADWEHITVGLAGSTPRFVGYSEHCFGTWLPWTRVEVATPGSTHPVVYVGEGTHANYPRASEFPLRGARCARPAQPRYYGAVALAFALAEPGGRLEVPADYAFGETDRIGQQTVPHFDVRVVDPTDPKLAAFPGTWGLDNHVSYGRSASYAGGGPKSPAHHAEWKDPGTKILCNRIWFTPLKRPRCKPSSLY